MPVPSDTSTLFRRMLRVPALVAAGALLPCLAVAADLYRWVEPDGSITFSPHRPAAGIEFEVVSAATPTANERDAFAAAMSGDASGAGPGAAPAPTPVAASQGPASPAGGSGVSYAPSPPGLTSGLTSGSTPQLGAAVTTDASEGIRASGEATVVARPSARGPANDVPGTNADTVTVPVDPAAAKRRAQCRELEKRVVSLERSLMQEMAPARMDDTVMAMARYQSSFDAHCRR